MSRDQRLRDNWALIHASDLAKKSGSELAVVFCLTTDFPGATMRHYAFMLDGLREFAQSIQLLNIPFYLLQGDPAENLGRFIKEFEINHVVTDFDPLRIKRRWKQRLAELTDINLTEVDAHNIVPARFVTDKQEYGAYTLRPKIRRHLESFLDPFPEIIAQRKTEKFRIQQTDWTGILKSLKADRSVPEANWIHAGEEAALDMMNYFINEKLVHYAEKRNDPNADVTSNLSPYLHFGQISAQRIAMEILARHSDNSGTGAFLEELIVRRELSDNYCHFNEKYDTLENIPQWARKTLDDHRKDERDILYSEEILENGITRDPLWNAAQNEMKVTGKMNGYMRMYWGKKILEWTDSPEKALKYAIYLNDKYELDGRDPNGYAGCAWAIAGVHDRPWSERPVFGKIRYMNFNGAKRKFDVDAYIRKWAAV